VTKTTKQQYNSHTGLGNGVGTTLHTRIKKKSTSCLGFFIEKTYGVGLGVGLGVGFGGVGLGVGTTALRVVYHITSLLDLLQSQDNHDNNQLCLEESDVLDNNRNDYWFCLANSHTLCSHLQKQQTFFFRCFNKNKNQQYFFFCSHFVIPMHQFYIPLDTHNFP
jgi:hypothetical protein